MESGDQWIDLATKGWIAFSSVVTFASVIVKMTPNKWDDNLLDRILKFVSLNKGGSDPKM